MRVSGKTVKLGLLTGVLVLAIISTVWYFQYEPQEEVVKAIPIEVYTIDSDEATETIQIPGTTQSGESVLLRFQVSGRIIEKNVRLGDRVKKGDVLAIVDNPEIEPLALRAAQNLEQLEVQYRQARRDFKRIDELYQEQAVTTQEWEQVKTRLDSSRTAASVARAESVRADRLFEELQLLAPFDGLVTEILVDEGDVVQSGTPVARISNPAVVELEIAVSDAVVANLTTGKPVEVTRSLQPNAPSLQGVIADISPFRERASLPQVVIALDAADISPGVAVSAKLKITRTQGLMVPISAVLMTGEDSSAVYRVDAGTASLVPVRPLRIGSDSVLVDAVLEAGDDVVVAGIKNLYHGAAVRVLQ